MTTPWMRFWQPGLDWLNEANMTNYRSLNAMRISVAIVGAGIIAFLGNVFMFWRSTWMAGGYLEATSVSALLMSAKEAASFATNILEAMLWFATAVGGFAITGSIAKRATNTDHQVKIKMAQAEVERAKKQPVVVPSNQTDINMPGGGDTNRTNVEVKDGDVRTGE